MLISRFLINLRRANVEVVNRADFVEGGRPGGRTERDEETHGEMSTMRFSADQNAHTATTGTTATAAEPESRVERLVIGPMGGDLGDGSDFGSSMLFGDADEDESSGYSGYKSEEDVEKRFDVPLETKEGEKEQVEVKELAYDEDAASGRTKKGKAKETIEEVSLIRTSHALTVTGG